MDKINHTTKDILGGNIEKIAQLFPSVVTEAQDEATGELKKVVDFDLLRQHLSDTLVEGDRERFRLDWPGKKASILKANTPISKTLRPVREDSVDFDTTQNVFIEGDNFEVLKVLQESYLGKIKMIYIDPPYNTGKDFIYRDNFTQDREDYEEEIGVRDDENGGKLVKNTETNGRYHSDWLSMLQERLIVARDLLTDDGVIFISIGDNEYSHLKELGDEVFGEENFIGNIAVKSTPGGKQASTSISSMGDYLVIFGRSQSSVIAGTPLNEEEIKKYNLQDERGQYLTGRLRQHGIAERREDVPTLYFPIYFNEQTKDISTSKRDGYNVEVLPLLPAGGDGRWIWSKEKIQKDKNNIEIKQVKRNGSLVWDAYFKKYYDNSMRTKLPSIVLDNDVRTEVGSKALRALFDGKKYFDFPKPVYLIQKLINSFNDKNFVVLDFFSGSSTTAHAVMQLNAEDGGNRRHIQVQLAEPTDEKSEAYKAGYKSIPEISRERIRRAGKKIREDYAEQIAKRDVPLDTGFRAYKLASSNFVDTAQHPAQTTQASLLDTTDNIKDDRTPEDLLTEVILDLGLTLDLPIEHRDIAGHSVFFVGGNSMVACFDDSVSLDIVDGIAAEKPLRVVFKDSSFANDETRINIDIRLKQLSPDTTVQVV